MHHLPRILGLLAALVLVAAAAGTRAQTRPADQGFGGVYRYAEDEDAGQRRIVRAVQPVLRTLNPVVRSLASNRLRETEIPREIGVTVRGGHVAVRYAGSEGEYTFRSRTGRPRTITSDAGRQARLTQLFRGGQLQQIFEGEHGRWYNLFELDESEQRLTLRVVITDERLDSPIRVHFPYVRAR